MEAQSVVAARRPCTPPRSTALCWPVQALSSKVLARVPAASAVTPRRHPSCRRCSPLCVAVDHHQLAAGITDHAVVILLGHLPQRFAGGGLGGGRRLGRGVSAGGGGGCGRGRRQGAGVSRGGGAPAREQRQRNSGLHRRRTGRASVQAAPACACKHTCGAWPACCREGGRQARFVLRHLGQLGLPRQPHQGRAPVPRCRAGCRGLAQPAARQGPGEHRATPMTRRPRKPPAWVLTGCWERGRAGSCCYPSCSARWASDVCPRVGGYVGRAVGSVTAPYHHLSPCSHCQLVRVPRC